MDIFSRTIILFKVYSCAEVITFYVCIDHDECEINTAKVDLNSIHI